ncbi:hypothetical protein O9G_005398 [Rozella allomycis CSF55]|uniref:Uncharacterized protein n=1 Tax=Rozella allomycis (strain CSF55) TaxID=988480 RepID=A0A075B4N2_ROZAC|nr:hypothetical protein O9G_005398 [Rozella allomycis CSF55]|eukprot:EPZ36488.1 hypothetical protein O9G_005398 [Rozella allomycis CSF55]
MNDGRTEVDRVGVTEPIEIFHNGKVVNHQFEILYMGFDIACPINNFPGLDLHAKLGIVITGITSKCDNGNGRNLNNHVEATKEVSKVPEELNIPITTKE